MFSAQGFEVRGVCGTTEIVGNRVVEVAELGRTITPRKTTGEIAASHEVRQRRRRSVTRLRWSITGMDYRAQLGDPAGRHIGENIGGHCRSARHEAETRSRTRRGRPWRRRTAGFCDHLGQALPAGDELGGVVLGPFTVHG